MAPSTLSLRLPDGRRLRLHGRVVDVDGSPSIHLTERERAVLESLARRRGAVVSKRTLLEEVWAGESDGHVVEVTVARLRRRLGPGGTVIETVLRRGYRISTH